jgi:multiple sugar transport system permease protein
MSQSTVTVDQPATTARPLPGRKPSAFRGIRREETFAGYLFILPNFIGFLVFSALPIIAAFVLSFTIWDLAEAPRFVGLENYRTLIHDNLAGKTLFNTFYYSFVAVPTGVFIAFWLAYLMNRQIRGIVIFRTIYFLPSITLGVAVAVVWRWLYHPDLGLFNHLLAMVGITGPNWLYSSRWAMPALIIMGNWQGIGYAMLIFLAGLQGIPTEYYEAATIDGANEWQKLRYITAPMLSPTTFFILVTSLIGAFQGFDQFYIMTRGGPAFATTTLVLYIYNNAFSFFKMGYAAALAAVLFACILVMTIIQWRVARSWVYGADE